MAEYECPNDGPFDAEVETRVSQSGHDVAIADASGQQPNMADQADAGGLPLLAAQRAALVEVVNPAWTPTYEFIVLDEPVEHRVAVCPECGSPIKVG